jgi:hypothetical protein
MWVVINLKKICFQKFCCGLESGLDPDSMTLRIRIELNCHSEDIFFFTYIWSFVSIMKVPTFSNDKAH